MNDLSLFKLVAVALTTAATLGCGGESKAPLHPVSGQVLLKGRPAANALVVFHDSRPSEELRNLPIPRATTDSEGRFRLSSYMPDSFDGAPSGEYVVTVTLPAAAAPSDVAEVDPESIAESPDQLRGKYADPNASPLRAEVKDGDNQLPPFDVG